MTHLWKAESDQPAGIRHRCQRPGCSVLSRLRPTGLRGGLRREISIDGGLTWVDVGGCFGKAPACVGAPDPGFWGRVSKQPGGGCWIWTGARNTVRNRHGSGSNVYGQFRVRGRLVYAHRHAWELLRGPIPEGYRLARGCFDPMCVRPGHWILRELPPAAGLDIARQR